MSYIVLNFAYGFGPFLRTTELAVAVNDLLEKEGHERLGIIAPLVYGDAQKRIMLEHFAGPTRTNRDDIWLDSRLGKYLQMVFYGEAGYEKSLRRFARDKAEIERKIQDYFSSGLLVENLLGEKREIKRDKLALEINRCPRINFGVRPSYYTSFAYISEILERALECEAIKTEKSLLEKIIPLHLDIENNSRIHFIAEPGTFSYLDNYERRRDTEVRTPPNSDVLVEEFSNGIEEGIYTTVTGIPGLDELFRKVQKFGLKIYTNKPESVPGGVRASPAIVRNKNILLHFARSGWGSIWLSQIMGVPFVAPEYESDDDPEIYFNNLCVEKLGLGKIYRGQSVEELLKFGKEYKNNVEKINSGLVMKFGTLDGLRYTALRIVDDLKRAGF